MGRRSADCALSSWAAGSPSRASPRRRPDPSVMPLGRGSLGCLAGARVEQRTGGGERLPGLQQRLQTGQDLRPTAIELVVGAVAQLVVCDGEPAGILDRLDLPRHPGRALALHVVAPQSVEALDEPPRRVDLDVLAFGDRDARLRVDGLIARARLPVRLDSHPEAVLPPHLGVGDRLPELLGDRLDVDLEDLLHGFLQMKKVFEIYIKTT